MSGRGGWGNREWYPTFAPSKPIAVEGGLATTRDRGAIAESWWSKRFVAVLESYGLGGRMQRGRKYARSGQVISLDVTGGTITSKVQGSRAKPYGVTVRVTAPTEQQWAQLDAVIQRRVGFVAQLLAGEVPPELETAFNDADVALFPRSWREVTSSCSCPDYENPCKHIAAVLYLFADRLDSDPWLLLLWRGRTRDQLLSHLNQGVSGGGAAEAAAAVAPWWPLVPGNLNTEAMSTYDKGRAIVPESETPGEPSAVLARIGDLTVKGKAVNMSDRLGTLYNAIVDQSPDSYVP